VQAARRTQFTSIKYRTVHPVVRVHPPPSGERGLFIGGFAQRIVGLSPGESRKILDLLQAYVARPEKSCGTAGRRTSSSCSTTASPSTTPSTTTTVCRAGCTGSRSRGDIPVGIEGKESYVIEGDASHYTSVAA
jgi:taurine dioxygenase